MPGLIRYFAERSFVANVVMFGLILSSLFFWDVIGKEERPEFARKWVRGNIPYPGASAEDVEKFVIKPIEEQFKGISGLDEVGVTAAFGQASFSVFLDPNIDNLTEKYQEIKDAVERADLPLETEDPVYHRFNSSEKAIVDIAIYLEGEELLDVSARQKLQQYALTFRNQLLSLPEVSGVENNGYLKPELQIKVQPRKLLDYELPLSEIARQIEAQHLRTPLGVLEDKYESEVALKSFLDDIEPLKQTVLRKSFQGSRVLLSDLANVEHGFERTTSILKIQGHEAVVFNVQKSRGVGILKAREAVQKLSTRFAKSHHEANIRVLLLDDESYDVRNRLGIISTNGLAGFAIILLVLFFFLDFRSGFWVAMGLPFSLAFTLLACLMAGYTVNNVTLAAVIIVLGIVVDDAIIVADNIAKYKNKISDPILATSQATRSVLQPVLAGVLTTCVAFIPLLFFEGRFGSMVQYIPLVVSFMLLASLIESYFILPAHLVDKKTPAQKRGASQESTMTRIRLRIMGFLEARYRRALTFTLRWRIPVLGLFLCFLVGSFLVFKNQLNFVMFPREQPKEFAVTAIAPKGTTRWEMAEKIKKIEKLFIDDKFNAVVGFRTSIGQSRRGGQVHENRASLRIEILPPSELETPSDEMMAYWEAEAKKLKDFDEVRFLESWWSNDSGSPIAIEVLENNDEARRKVSERLKSELEKLSSLKNVEIERPIKKNEFALDLDRAKAMRLNIDIGQLARTLRAYIQGQILYRLYTEEEVDVRLTSIEGAKTNIEQVLDLRASNNQGYLVPMRQVVTVREHRKPANIQRVNYKRANMVYADLDEKTEETPLNIAQHLEEEVFPQLMKESPTTLFNFRGEIQDSRESQSDFVVSVLMTLGLIYIILTFMFGSLTMPLVIGSIIPFGVAGVIYAFWGHGMNQFGFFAVIGAIGMLGVVINDSIVMVDCFETDLKAQADSQKMNSAIVEVANTRLRPVLLTTLTTVAGIFPTAYGLGGYDAMLADMMLAMGWGLIFGTGITLFLMPIIYSFLMSGRQKLSEVL